MAAVVAADVHAVTVKVHLALFLERLWRRYSGVEGGTGRRVVVGGVERRGHGGAIEKIRVRGTLRHERRPNGREAKLLLKRAGRVYDGVFGQLETGRVYGKGHMGLRRAERGWLQRRLVERVVVEGSLIVGIARDHGAVDGRDLRRSLCASLGWLIRRMLAWWSQDTDIDKDSLVARQSRSCEHDAGHKQTHPRGRDGGREAQRERMRGRGRGLRRGVVGPS